MDLGGWSGGKVGWEESKSGKGVKRSIGTSNLGGGRGVMGMGEVV